MKESKKEKPTEFVPLITIGKRNGLFEVVTHNERDINMMELCTFIRLYGFKLEEQLLDDTELE